MILPRDPPLAQRALARVLNVVGWLANGYGVPFAAELVRTYGVRGMAEKSAAVTELAALIEARLGERDGHLLLGFASIWNGCQVCSLGHILAANLAHFRDRGAVHPLDERELQRRIRTSSDAELLAHIEGCLTAPEDARILGLVRRLYAIKRDEDDGVDAEPGDAEMLAGAIAAYDWINHCTIYSEDEEPPIVAFSALNRRLLLRARYGRARAAAAGR